jgi:hypothetical protein
MAGTLGRLRFYLFCDLSVLQVDYAPTVADYPDYPRDAGTVFYDDNYKSALGSNFWRYNKGESIFWNMDWVNVSEDCSATMGMIIGSAHSLSPHVVIWESQGIDGITLGSLVADVVPFGTYFCNNDSWNPKEVDFGLWNFTTQFIKES